VPTSFVNDPEHWRKRAEEMRKAADNIKDEKSKQRMLWVADDYDHLAKQATRRKQTDPLPRAMRSLPGVLEDSKW
jgi:hypothetical protein